LGRIFGHCCVRISFKLEVIMGLSAPTGFSAPRGNVAGYKLKNVPNYTPEQMQIFSQLLGGLQGGGLEKGLQQQQGLAGGDEEAFGQLEKPAYSAFQKTLGQIGTRFGGLGAMGSSAFQNATSGAAQSLAENLGSQRMGIQNNALDRLMGLSDKLLGAEPFSQFLEPKSKGFDFGSLLGGLGGKAIGGLGGGIGQALLPKILKLLGLG